MFCNSRGPCGVFSPILKCPDWFGNVCVHKSPAETKMLRYGVHYCRSRKKEYPIPVLVYARAAADCAYFPGFLCFYSRRTICCLFHLRHCSCHGVLSLVKCDNLSYWFVLVVAKGECCFHIQTNFHITCLNCILLFRVHSCSEHIPAVSVK